MERLAKSQRQRLQTLFNELEDMGISAEQPWLDDISATSASDERESSVTPLQIEELEIESADYKLLKSLLDIEPETVVALLLSFREWSWRRTYLESCEAEKRKRIVAIENRGAKHIRPALLELLIKEFAAKLSDPEAQELVSNVRQERSIKESDHAQRGWRLLWQR